MIQFAQRGRNALYIPIRKNAILKQLYMIMSTNYRIHSSDENKETNFHKFVYTITW